MAIDTDESVAATATQLLLAPIGGCRATFLLLTPTPRSCYAVASFPDPTKERGGPGTHCSRMRGIHGNQVAGVIDEAQTELVYL